MFQMSRLKRHYEASFHTTGPCGPLPLVFDGHLVYGPFKPLNTEGFEIGGFETLYNCSGIMEMDDGKKIIAVRYEAFNNELGSVVLGHIDEDGLIILDGPRFGCAQDPTFVKIAGKIILSFNGYTSANAKITSVRQYFYFLDDLTRPFAIGPLGQKCCRLIDLPGNKIGIMGRRQDWPIMRGQLTYTEIDSLAQLQEAISQAELIGPITNNNCWLGANQLLPLDSRGRYIGILGHIAELISGKSTGGAEKKRYFATASVFDRKTKRIIAMNIIADAADLPFKEDAKMNLLDRVIYPGGLVRQKGPFHYRLYGGYGDIRCFYWDLNIPLFDQYED